MEGRLHIGIEVPKGLLGYEDSLAAGKTLLQQFRAGGNRWGLNRVYIVSELTAWPSLFHKHERPDKKSGGDWLAPWLGRSLLWTMDSTARSEETHMLRESIAPRRVPQQTGGQWGGCSRPLWWTGSGNAALGLPCPKDMAQGNAFGEMCELAQKVEMECRNTLGEKFEGAEVLGWMGEELSFCAKVF